MELPSGLVATFAACAITCGGSFWGSKANVKTVASYMTTMTQVQTLVDEHLACLKVVTEKMNTGIIAQRLKGGKVRV